MTTPQPEPSADAHTPPLHAVLWDLDGTIVDSEPLWLQAETEMLDRYGLTLDSDTRDRLIGCALTDGAKLFQNLGVPLSVSQIVDEWSRRVGELFGTQRPQWRPGAVELLRDTHAAGLQNIVVTMSTRHIAERALAYLPGGCVNGLVAGDDGAGRKPDPHPYLKGAELAGTTAPFCVAIEDSPTGVTAAAASGAVTVAVTHMLSLATVPAHVRLNSLAGVAAPQLSIWHTQYFGTTPAQERQR